MAAVVCIQEGEKHDAGPMDRPAELWSSMERSGQLIEWDLVAMTKWRRCVSSGTEFVSVGG